MPHTEGRNVFQKCLLKYIVLMYGFCNVKRLENNIYPCHYDSIDNYKKGEAVMNFSYDSRIKKGEVDPEYYINQNKNIRTFYDPENPNYNEKDIRDVKQVKIKENLFYGFIIVIMLLFFGKLLFL